MQKIRELLFFIYLVLLFYYGLAIKFLYNTVLIQYLKFIPEIVLTAFLILLLLQSGRLLLTRFDLILLLLIALIYVLSSLAIPNMSSVILSVRDFLFPIISLIVIKNSSMHEEDIYHYYKIFVIVAGTFLLASVYFGYLQHINTFEYMSKFYIGKVVYGKDAVSSITIKTVNGGVRALGLVGDSTKYGFYSLLSMIVLSCWFKTRKAAIVSFVLATINIYFSTNKTALVLAFVLFLFIYSKLFSGLPKNIAISVILIGLLVLAYSIVKNPQDFFSVYDRLENWRKGDYITAKNIIIGTQFFQYFNGGWMSIMDNTYLFGVCSVGIVGYAVLFAYFFKNSFNISTITQSLLIVFIIAGLSTNLFSARTFIGLFCILCGIENVVYRNKFNIWAGSEFTTSRKKIQIKI